MYGQRYGSIGFIDAATSKRQYRVAGIFMTKILGKTNTLLALLTLALMFSIGANAAAFHGTPPKCATSAPGTGDAFVYTGTTYGGTCYVLHNNSFVNDLWTSWDASTGFPNDQIQSVWVGPGMTLVLFWNDFDTSDNGVPLHFGPGQYSENLGSWNKKASAARVQIFPFGQCSGYPGTLSFYTDQNFSSANDCTVLVRRIRADGSFNYESPVDMGFRNDSMTSFINNSAFDASFFSNTCFFGLACSDLYTMAAYSSSANVGGDFNDQLSNIHW